MTRYLPILIVVAVILLTGALPIARFRLRYGKSPVASLGRFRWVLRAFGLLLLAQAIWPRRFFGYALFQPQPVPGLLVLALGVAIVVRAQWEMGSSWRIGIEEGAKPGLITAGIYRYSRNPIYLGILLEVLGVALAMPTAISILFLVMGVFGVWRLVFREERYLFATYGVEFAAYASRVGRFVPGLGLIK